MSTLSNFLYGLVINFALVSSTTGALSSCQPPTLSSNLTWTPSRTIYYEGEVVKFSCAGNDYRPTHTSTTCLSTGLFDHPNVICRAPVFDCYNKSDRGTSYRGKKTREDCISWKEANSPHVNGYHEDHKLCRNPHDDVLQPYCYTSTTFVYELCTDVPECDKDCSTTPNDNLKQCDALSSCQPPTLSSNLTWTPNRTIYYEGEVVEFSCAGNDYRPTHTSTTCLSTGLFDHPNVICRAPVFDCYNKSDRGTSYRGKKTREDCISWKEANSPHVNGYHEDHKLCRNPHDDVLQPYCYTSTTFVYELCTDVPECGTGCYINPVNGLSPCDFYFTCNPPNETSLIYKWGPNRSLFYTDEEILFHCREEGYIPTVNTSTCLLNGSFERVNVECIGIPCPKFPEIPNISSVNSNHLYRFPESVKLECKTGYDLEGPEFVNCTASGDWSAVPNCTGKPCPLIGDISNSTNEHKSQYRFPESVFIKCLKGYVINGSDELNCTTEGKWNKLIPTCIGIRCPNLKIINLSQHQASRTYRYPESLKIECNSGYVTNGPETVKCNDNGNWSTLPTCTGVDCGTFPDIQHIKPSINNRTSGNQYPVSVRIECDEGYQREGPEKVGCTAAGKWSQAPNCTEIKKESLEPLSTTNSGPILGGSIAGVAVLLIVVVIVAIVVLRKRRQMGKKRDHIPTIENVIEGPNLYANSRLPQKDCSNDEHAYYDFEDTKIAKTAIKVDEFYEYVHNGRDKDGAIEKEFNLLKTGLLKPATAAQLPANTKKNKYKNIYPYDETRVELDLVDGIENSDYVNASFINGFDQLKQYIASQGPLGPTVVDWWRMVWQFNCGKIVMLTRVFEMGKQKCMQYWPELEEKSKTYGNIEVVIAKEYIYSDFTIRTLKLTQDQETKTVTQFHFTAWPDKDVPKYASSLVHFRHQVLNTKCTGTGPLVVHCSAGIGRTGTYIALDYAVREAKQLGYVDVFRCVETLRRQRLNMVQTSRQYVFLHESVLEALMCKDAGIPAAEFRDVFQQLMKKENGKTQLEKDYVLMMNMGHKHDEEVFDKGKSPENKTKNRYKNILPVESEMPILTTYVEGLNDYINAVFLPGYKNNKTFLITQMPLESTVIDLWRMIWDYNVEMIVMMNQSYEKKEGYWPTANDKSSAYGPFSVSLQDMQTDKVMTKIHLKLSYKNEEPRELKVLQSKFWSDDSSIPSSMDDFITFMSELEREHEHQGNGPVIVHCSNGCDKSGLYCVMATVIERLKIEQDVDIQHIIKNMRNRRPQIIPNFDQYCFLHEAVIRYLQQFDTYSNFQ